MAVEYEKRKNKKEIIINAALSEFAKKGYEKTSVRDIAKAAGVTTGALYYHYKNKEALVLDVIDHVISVYEVQFTNKNNISKSSVTEVIIDCIADNFNNIAAQRQRILAISSILTMKSSSAVRQLVITKYNRIIDIISSDLADVFDRKKSECKPLAVFLLAGLDGITLQLSLNVDIGSKEQLQETYIKFYKRSIKEFLE